MNEEQLQKARLTELADKSYKQNIYTYSTFLNPAELIYLDEIRQEIEYVDYETFGGHELCERKIVRFGSFKQLGYEDEWPISTILAEPIIEKFSDELTHRDFLGALMNLGVERSVLGDILVKENKRAYIFCKDNISEFIVDNITKIKHTNVKCRVLKKDEEVPELELKLIDEHYIVSATRFDAIVAAVTKCSRSVALNMFKAGKITHMGKLCERNSMSLKEGDIFSVRGYGKFQFCGATGETRKGRIYVHLKRYA